jgi:hypothetical protein
MLHSIIAEEEDVNGARLSQPGSHQSTGWHKPSDVEALDLKWRSNWKEQCFNDTSESAWTSYLAMLSPTCQNAAETKKKTWCQFRQSQEILSYSSRFAQPRIKYLKNSGIARPSKTIERTFRSHACTIAWAAPHDIRCRSKQKSPHVFSQTRRFTPSSTTCWAPCLWKWPGTEI